MNYNTPRRSFRALTLAFLGVLVLLVAGVATPALAQSGVPDAPAGLSASSVAHNGVTLAWDDPADSSITGYLVLRRSRDGTENGDGQGAAEFVPVVDDTGSSAASYTDTTVSPRTRYVYRVKARNSAGLGPRFSYANAETAQAPAAPAKPTGLQLTTALDSSVTFEWGDSGDSSITHYKVPRRVGDSGKFTTIEENTGSTDTSYTDTTASAETGYEYRVVAVNGGGDSPESDSLTAETLPEASFTIVEVIEPEPEDDPIAERQVNLDDDRPDAPRLHVDGEPENHKEWRA